MLGTQPCATAVGDLHGAHPQKQEGVGNDMIHVAGYGK